MGGKEKELNKAAIVGVFWNFVQLFINRGFEFFLKLILAKILIPEDFGIVGMALVFITFIQVFNELGFSAALIQRADEDLTESHYHTVFWANLIWALFIYLFIYFILTPLVVGFYNQPILNKIIPVIGIGILLNPINIIHHAQLVRSLNFKRIALINNSSTIISGIISIILALRGYGVWSLVLPSVFSYFVSIPLYFYTTKWIPKFIFCKKSFKDIFGFGIQVTGSNMLTTFVNQFDYLVVGKLLSAYTLGIYSLAFALTDTFRHQLMKIINSVMYPIYSKKKQDLQSLKEYYLSVVKYNSVVILPIMTFFVVFGEPFISSFFGEKWIDVVVPLKYLALSVSVHMIVNNISPVLRGVGKPRLEVNNQLFKTVIYVPTIFLGTYFYGLVGTSIAILVNKFILVVIDIFFLRKVIDIRYIEIFNSLKIAVIACIIASLVSLGLYFFGLHFIICAILLFLIYGVIILFLIREELLLLYKGLMYKNN